VSSDADPAPETSAEQYRQRALLLADLGRYDEAAGEIREGLTAAPGDAGLLTTLSRLYLAAGQADEALAAADRALAAAPDTVEPLVVRGGALADLRRFGDAAQVATDVLGRWPGDAYAQRAGAALLSESRNGQPALDAAWRAVSLQPTEADAHLVLSVVAARLRLFDLAQRAYGEALELDPALADAGRDVGLIRYDRRRWSKALEELADAATLPMQVAAPEPPKPAAPGPVIAPPAPGHEDIVARVRQVVLYAAAVTLVAGVVTALMAAVGEGVSRAWAGVVGVAGIVVLAIWAGRRLGGGAFARVRATERRLTFAVIATFLAPLGVVAYAAVGGPWPLAAAMALAGAAELAVVTDRRRG
jgi:tetratricopeptide (TPR) repeat protein